MLSLPVIDNTVQRPTYAAGPRSLAAVKLLRLSVTDRCNLRCAYCMPAEGVPFDDHADLLSADEFVAVADAAVRVGIRHIKVTGGEPTVRRDLLTIIERIARLGIDDLSMTTNGLSLSRSAHDLRRAGLDRLTVSWDSMQPTTLGRLTGSASADASDTDAAKRGRDLLDRLRAGIDAAVDAGFDRLKINVVVIGGVNDSEVADFAALTRDQPWTVRFIEYMPLGNSQYIADANGKLVGSAVTQERIEAAHGKLLPVSRDREVGVGPANVFALPGAQGRIGFISAMSKPFCETCNRLRLTARGELRSCLFDGGEVDILPALRPSNHASPDTDAIIHAMAQCVALKPDVHSNHGNRAMSQLGG